MRKRGALLGPLLTTPGLLDCSAQLSAVIAKTMAGTARASFILGNVAPRQARAVIVMDSLFCGLLGFIDRVKFGNSRHGVPPSALRADARGEFG